jgi:hypothetical protein
MYQMQKLDRELYDSSSLTVTLDEIRKEVKSIRNNVFVIEQFQLLAGRDHSTDLNHLKNVFSNINFWSLIQLALILTTGFLQVFMVKGFFR